MSMGLDEWRDVIRVNEKDYIEVAKVVLRFLIGYDRERHYSVDIEEIACALRAAFLAGCEDEERRTRAMLSGCNQD